MSNYFSLRPMGEGTEEVENFHSYFYRFAKLHSTTMIPMARHLADWWNSSFHERVNLKDVYLYKANRLPLCGYNDAVVNYVKVVSIAAHQPNLHRTTILAIRAAADTVSHGALRRGRAWCPACMYWSEKEGSTYYDRLLWTLAAMKRCPVHRIALVAHCPSCGVQQLCYHSLAGMTHCAKCLDSLVQLPATWIQAPHPGFGESDCVALVSAIADGTLTTSVPRAFMIFCEELRSLAEPFMKGRHNPSLRVGPRSWRMTQINPMLGTMLKRCHLSGVRLVDVLTDPRGAARVAGQLAYSGFNLPATLKPRRVPEVAKRVHRHLVRAIARPEGTPFVSLSALAESLGVSKGFIRYQEPVLSKAYIARAQAWITGHRKRMKRLARALLIAGPMHAYLAGEIKSQDDLVDHLCAETGVRKHVARLLVSDALSRHAKLRRLDASSELSHNEKAVLWKGKRAGYM